MDYFATHTSTGPYFVKGGLYHAVYDLEEGDDFFNYEFSFAQRGITDLREAVSLAEKEFEERRDYDESMVFVVYDANWIRVWDSEKVDF
jgi:hypothetical protein